MKTENYSYTTATFHCLLIGDLVFKLNPAPENNGGNSNTYPHCHRARRARSRNPSNLITITDNGLHRNGYVNLYGANNKTAGSPLASRISLCSLNARSLRNKTAAFVGLVCDVKADIFTICESWLTANDSAVLSELSPPGYKTLCHCPRANQTGGGTALLSRDGIEVVKVFSTDKSSFKVSEWLVSTGATRLRVIIVYRPPYSAEHPVSTSIFINEFTDYLESVVMFTEPLIISGDSNIHVDMSHSPDTIRFRDLLDSMGLMQHVKRPTHEKGHTLDLIITRQCDNIVATEPLAERYFSDHAAIICELTIIRSKQSVKHAEYRKLKSINVQQFRDDIRNSNLCVDPPSALDTLVDCYNRTLSSLLDKHAPVQSRHTTARVRPPWFNDDIKKARQERRKAEKRWRAIRLPEDLAAFKVKRNYVIHIMNEARRKYYKQFIEDNGDDQSKLFRASKRRLNMQQDKTLPPYTDALTLANEMGEFFVHKITSIRSKLTTGDQYRVEIQVM